MLTYSLFIIITQRERERERDSENKTFGSTGCDTIVDLVSL